MNQPKQQTPKKPDLSAFNQIPLKFTDMEVQFIAKTIERKERLKQQLELQAIETLQHFSALTAKRKNIQFNDELFAGVVYEPEKQRAIILTHKNPPKKETSAPDAESKD